MPAFAKVKSAWILTLFGFAPLKAVELAFKWFGARFEFNAGGLRTVLFSEPKDIREILDHHLESFQKDQFTLYMKELWGRGMILAESEDWRRSRRKSQPYFGAQFLKVYTTTFRQLAVKRIGEWRSGTVDVSKAGLEFSIEAVLGTLFGVEPAAHTDSIVKNLDRILNYFLWVQAAAGFMNHPEKMRVPSRIRYEKAIIEMRNFADTVFQVAEKRNRPDLYMVDRLVKDWSDGNPNLNRELIKDEIVTFLVAGHESTALSIAYTLHLLSMNPTWAERVIKEYEMLPFDRVAPLILSKDAPLMEAVVRESLRLYPPVWISGREASKDVIVNGLALKKGDQAHLCFWNAHRDSSNHHLALNFDPNRWLTEHRDSTDSAFFAFGGGPRQCIGMQFAYTEIGIIVGEVLKRFVVHPISPEIKLKATVTIRPKTSIKLNFQQRPQTKSGSNAS